LPGIKQPLRIAWLCPYPVDTLPKEKVRWNKNRRFHPATWVINLSNALAKRDDIELHIITETAWVSKDYRFYHNRIFFHILRNPYSVPFLRRGFPSRLHLDTYTRYFLNFLNLSGEIKRVNPDIIHVHGTESQYAYCASRISSRPVLISMQGICGFLKDGIPGMQYREQFEVDAIKNSKYFVSRAKISDEYIMGINHHAKLFKIDDICDDMFFDVSRAPQPARLLFAGSVLESKGIEDLLASFAMLRKDFREIKLRIAGHCDESYKNVLKEKYVDYSAGDGISFLGQIDRDAILREYSRADLFVFPSHFETSPNVIMEAMSAGLPIVATKAGGIPDMINDGKTGILVNINAPVQIAEKVKHLLENPELKSRLANAAREFAGQRFREEIVVRKTMGAYKNILSSD